MINSVRQAADSQRRGFAYFHIAWTLAKRELKSRYRGSWLGFLWTFVEPLVLTFIFFFIFVIIFRQEYPNYLLYLLGGMLPFFFLQNSVTKATGCLLNYSSLIRQIYCPREVFVMVGVLSELYHFVFSLVVLAPFYFYYDTAPTWRIVAIVPAVILVTLYAYGLGLFFATLNVFVRDTRIFISLLFRMWFYITPIFYTVERFSNASPTAFFLYNLNPLVALFGIFRWALVPTEPFPEMQYVLIMLGEVVIGILIGVFFFARNDNTVVKLL
jgi:ABC-type polysaccharide/polyol phosphate export permease